MRYYEATDKCVVVPGGEIKLCQGAESLCDRGYLDRSTGIDTNAKPSDAKVITMGILIGGPRSDFYMTFCPVCGIKHHRKSRKRVKGGAE